jgi:hypothetical protein
LRRAGLIGRRLAPYFGAIDGTPARGPWRPVAAALTASDDTEFARQIASSPRKRRSTGAHGCSLGR